MQPKMIHCSSITKCLGLLDGPQSSHASAVVKAADPTVLNNLAVSLLKDRRRVEALRLLDEAWSLQAVMEQAQQSLTSLFSFPAPSLELAMASLAAKVYDDRKPSIFSTPADEGTSTSVSVADDLDLSASPSNYFAVYNGAFVFNEDKANSMNVLQRMRLVPAILLYNMGLIYHKQALETIHGEDFSRAFHMYRASLEIVEDCIRCSLYSADYSLLQLAIYNNLGFINSHFFDEKEAMVCAGRMLATFASMDCSRLLSKDEYVFYYMNLLFLLNRNPIFAPAA